MPGPPLRIAFVGAPNFGGRGPPLPFQWEMLSDSHQKQGAKFVDSLSLSNLGFWEMLKPTLFLLETAKNILERALSNLVLRSAFSISGALEALSSF